MVNNVIAFVAGPNDDPSNSSLSSGEIVECDSDCSQCCPENRSISMNERSSEEGANAICSKSGSKSSQQSGVKRRKQNSDSMEEQEESAENKENEIIDLQNRSKRTSKPVEGSKRGKCLYVTLTSLVSGAEEKKQVVVVHRKRKFEEISNALAKEQLNKSYAYNPSNTLDKSNIQEQPDQNKRNSALTVLHQDEDFHSLTDSFDKKLQVDTNEPKPVTFKVNTETFSLENLNVKPMTTELIREDLTEVLVQS